MPLGVNEGRPDGAQLYKMFLAGTLVYTDTTHKAWLDDYYNSLMLNPDIEVFTRLYPTYLSTYHPYTMYDTYRGTKTS